MFLPLPTHDLELGTLVSFCPPPRLNLELKYLPKLYVCITVEPEGGLMFVGFSRVRKHFKAVGNEAFRTMQINLGV